MSDIINDKCTGCSVINKELVPIGGWIYESKNFVLAQDAEVMIEGFLIIQAKRHVNSLLDFSEEENLELSNLLYQTRKALKELNICEEVTIVQEERSKHFHIWLFPYYDWMKEKFGKGIKYLRDINQYVMENETEDDRQKVLKTCERLKEYFASK